jgi:hypothetical protein
VSALEAVLLLTMLVAMPETNPALRGRKDWGLQLGERIARRLGWERVIFVPGAEDEADADADAERARLLAAGAASDDEESTLNGEGAETPRNYGTAASAHSPSSSSSASSTTTPRKPARRTYTPQVVMYIALMILIGFHKTSSDVIVPSFLAIPRLPPAADSNPLHFSGGFGLDSTAVGNVLVAQAVVGAACQLVIPHVVKRLGALPAMRLALVAYPITYLFTPFSVLLPASLGVAMILADLWLKISIVSLAYACHSIL